MTAGLLTWLLTLGIVGVAVHPERCPSLSRADVESAVTATVGWFRTATADDGRFIYRYDRDTHTELGGYSGPRHAGALVALYQASSHGFVGALDPADRALGWALARVFDTPIGPAFGVSTPFETGSTALLVAALDERRAATGDHSFDDQMIALGRTLAETVNDDGAVDALIDPARGSIPERSRFYTGETLWALARLHLTFPHEGFDVPALAVLRYLINDRDSVESPWPPVSDHWGAYALETMSRWPEPPPVDSATRTWIDRQVWMLGLQVRYESQRVGGITKLTRGDIALPAGVGTLGEAFGNLFLLDDREGILGDDRAAVLTRAACTTSLLVSRQAPIDPTDPLVGGAWFRQGVSQLDDQQHTLSTLLFTLDWSAS